MLNTLQCRHVINYACSSAQIVSFSRVRQQTTSVLLDLIVLILKMRTHFSSVAVYLSVVVFVALFTCGTLRQTSASLPQSLQVRRVLLRKALQRHHIFSPANNPALIVRAHISFTRLAANKR
jgi:hypothetical protein